MRRDRCSQIGGQLSLNILDALVTYLLTCERLLSRPLCPKKKCTCRYGADNNRSTWQRGGTCRLILAIGDVFDCADRAGLPVSFRCHDSSLFDEDEWARQQVSMFRRAMSVIRLTLPFLFADAKVRARFFQQRASPELPGLDLW